MESLFSIVRVFEQISLKQIMNGDETSKMLKNPFTIDVYIQKRIDRNCNVLPKTSNIHSWRMVLLHGGGADDNGKQRERASDDGAA